MQLGLLMKQLDDRLARKNDQYYRIENDPIDLPGQGVATRLYGEDDAGSAQRSLEPPPVTHAAHDAR